MRTLRTLVWSLTAFVNIGWRHVWSDHPRTFVWVLSVCLFYTWRFGPLGGVLMAAVILFTSYVFFARRFWKLRRVTAYHEAGHAVVDLEGHIKITFVTESNVTKMAQRGVSNFRTTGLTKAA